MTPAWLLKLVRLTRREYFADFWITPPITLALSYVSITHGFGLLWLAAFAVGAIGWTLYEYAAHRWISHKMAVMRDLHALHHKNQRDYIALHPLATIATYGAFWALFGIHSSALMVGFSFGYIAYSVLHTAFHYSGLIAGWFPRLKARHVAHHRYHGVNYGVTTGLWDRAFGTEAA